MEQPHEVWAKDDHIRVISVYPMGHHRTPDDRIYDVILSHGQTGHGTVEEFVAAHHLREAALVLSGGRGREYAYRDLSRPAAAKRVALARERWAKQGYKCLGTETW